MKNIKFLSIGFTLVMAMACTESDKKTVEEAINNNTPQTTFTAQTDGLTANAITGQAQYGTCTLSSDRSVMTYEKTILNHQGVDECYTDESSDGCGAAYGIDFSQPTPTLTRYGSGC